MLMAEVEQVAEDATHVVIATPAGRGAVATVLVDGPLATAAVARWFRPAAARPLASFAIGRTVFGRWQTDADAGEELVVCRRSPSRVEIHCHGGAAAIEAIVGSLRLAGCREQQWQTWLREVADDVLSAAALVMLSAARTQRVAGVLLDQYRGALRRALEDAIAALESNDLPPAIGLLEQLDRYANFGMHLTSPWRVVLAGRANVGKSSLINALLGYRRSIVFDEPGTTRDVVTASTALDGWPVELADTAGLRAETDEIERQGVERARRQMSQADLVVLVFDCSQPWSGEDAELLQTAGPALIVHNKCDVQFPGPERPPGLTTSAKTNPGIGRLTEMIAARLVPDPPAPGAAVPFDESHSHAIHHALETARNGDSHTAIRHLRSIAPRLTRETITL